MLEARNLEATRGSATLFSGLAFTLPYVGTGEAAISAPEPPVADDGATAAPELVSSPRARSAAG